MTDFDGDDVAKGLPDAPTSLETLRRALRRALDDLEELEDVSSTRVSTDSEGQFQDLAGRLQALSARVAQQHADLGRTTKPDEKEIPKEPYKELYKMLGEEEGVKKLADRSQEPWRQGVIFHHMPLKQLIEVGKTKVKPEFDKLCRSLESMFDGATFVPVNVKSLKRARTKCRMKYGNDPSQVSDIVRGTLTIPIECGLGRLYEVAEKLLDMDELSSSSQRVIYFTDRFQRPMSGGYMDMLVLLNVRGYVCELQLNFDELARVKESDAGHGAYEKERLSQDNITYAAMNNDLVTLSRNLEGNTGQGTCDMYGFMPQNYAAHYGNCKMVQKLLSHGAKPWLLDEKQQFALFQALLLRHFETSQELVTAMENSDIPNKSGVLPGLATSLALALEAAAEAEVAAEAEALDR